MKASQILVILVVAGVEMAMAQKTHGKYYCKQESVQSTVKNNEICQLALTLVRKPRPERLEGFEKLISGSINVSESIGPVGGNVVVEKMTQNGWKNENHFRPLVMKRICDMPYYHVLGPFLDHFSGQVNKVDCSIKQGYYTITDWTLEENLRIVFGDKFPFGKFRYTITLTVPGRDTPACGFAVVINVENLEQLEHSLKNKRGKKN